MSGFVPYSKASQYLTLKPGKSTSGKAARVWRGERWRKKTIRVKLKDDKIDDGSELLRHRRHRENFEWSVA
jgi:hypothetical protein